MKIGIIGSGYVGLTTGICLASLKHQIFIYDVNEKKLGEILEGKLPFFERGLGEILEKVSSTEEFRPQNNLDDLIRETDGCFVCVGTPTKNNSIDLSQIINSINSITESIKKNNKRNYKIIIRSTIIPNTSKDVILPILERELSELEFGLAVVPEFLREGNALDDFMNPDKIVITYKQKNTKAIQLLSLVDSHTWHSFENIDVPNPKLQLEHKRPIYSGLQVALYDFEYSGSLSSAEIVKYIFVNAILPDDESDLIKAEVPADTVRFLGVLNTWNNGSVWVELRAVAKPDTPVRFEPSPEKELAVTVPLNEPVVAVTIPDTSTSPITSNFPSGEVELIPTFKSELTLSAWLFAKFARSLALDITRCF